MSSYRDSDSYMPPHKRARASRLEWIGAGVCLASALVMIALTTSDMHGSQHLLGNPTTGRSLLRWPPLFWAFTGSLSMSLGYKRRAGDEALRLAATLRISILVSALATILAIAATIFRF